MDALALVLERRVSRDLRLLVRVEQLLGLELVGVAPHARHHPSIRPTSGILLLVWRLHLLLIIIIEDLVMVLHCVTDRRIRADVDRVAVA